MKKLVCVVLFCALVLGCVEGVSSELIDFSSYNFEELLSIKDALQKEINDRLTEGQEGVFENGLYIVGRDLEPGSYTLTMVEIGEYTFGDTIIVFKDTDQCQQTMRTGSYFQDQVVFNVSVSHSFLNFPLKIELSDGNVLSLSPYAKCTLIKNAD